MRPILNRRVKIAQAEAIVVAHPTLNRRKLGRTNIPRILHQELQTIPQDMSEAISPVLLDMFAASAHPLIVEAERMASTGMIDTAIAMSWDLDPKEFDTLRIEYEELDLAIRKGRVSYEAEQQEQRNNPFAVNVSAEDLETLDTTKLKDGMFKGIYALEATLFGQAGFEFNRMQKLQKTLTVLETDILSPEALAKLNKQERLQFYEMVNRNIRHSRNFLGKLHDSVASGLEAVSTVEKHKEASEKVIVAVSESESNNLAEIKSLILEQIREKVGKR